MPPTLYTGIYDNTLDFQVSLSTHILDPTFIEILNIPYFPVYNYTSKWSEVRSEKSCRVNTPYIFPMFYLMKTQNPHQSMGLAYELADFSKLVL